IFCRNLLIYLDRATQEQMMGTLQSLLSRNGFLFVAAAETYLASCCGFISTRHTNAFAFRKPKPAVETIEPKAAPLLITLPRTVPVVPKLPIARPPARIQQPADVAPADVPATANLEAAHRLADAGRLREAAELCEDHVRQAPASIDAWYLLGVVK